ncbi:hypothetical protein [Thalassomonas haliotis]|uniref:Uncharacterized protein n=1 Tax=Thalassomonas haliotis TaxID=485448 RepID=A0ABY7VBQ2_9GAMM|nr:hypothetical protein [Thalassomonas haliotis]WDE11009.1 hypothetical protein H3N35_22650 [Thalassomonas haliotis]
MTIFLWVVYLSGDPYAYQGGDTVGYIISSAMIGFSMLAFVGLIFEKVWLIFFAFIGSFIPMGLYMLGAENYMRFIGILNIVYLIIALHLFWKTRIKMNKEAGM